MYVDEGDVVDCHSMLIPPEKYSHLLQIEVDTRMEVATYMMENNYKLKSGKQEFLRTDPALDDLIGGEYGSFVFEEIQNNDEAP